MTAWLKTKKSLAARHEPLFKAINPTYSQDGHAAPSPTVSSPGLSPYPPSTPSLSPSDDSNDPDSDASPLSDESDSDFDANATPIKAMAVTAASLDAGGRSLPPENDLALLRSVLAVLPERALRSLVARLAENSAEFQQALARELLVGPGDGDHDYTAQFGMWEGCSCMRTHTHTHTHTHGSKLYGGVGGGHSLDTPRVPLSQLHSHCHVHHHHDERRERRTRRATIMGTSSCGKDHHSNAHPSSTPGVNKKKPPTPVLHQRRRRLRSASHITNMNGSGSYYRYHPGRLEEDVFEFPVWSLEERVRPGLFGEEESERVLPMLRTIRMWSCCGGDPENVGCRCQVSGRGEGKELDLSMVGRAGGRGMKGGKHLGANGDEDDDDWR